MQANHSPTHASTYTTSLKFIPFISLISRLKPSRGPVSKSLNHSPGFSTNFLQFQLPPKALCSTSVCTYTKMTLLPNSTQDFPLYTSNSFFGELTFILLSTVNIQIHFKVVVCQAKISQFVSPVCKSLHLAALKYHTEKSRLPSHFGSVRECPGFS